jgi:hypothetical protein
LVAVDLSTKANLKVWATVDRKGTARVVLINKEKSANDNVAVHLRGYGAGTLTRLLAPSYQSKAGITLEGQTFDGSGDGRPHGKAFREVVSPQNGTYEVAVPPMSAALLTASPQ